MRGELKADHLSIFIIWDFKIYYYFHYTKNDYL